MGRDSVAAGSRDLHLARRLGPWEVMAGVVLPVICLTFDPMVLRRSDELRLALGPDPMLPHSGAAGWVFVMLEGAALLVYGTVRVRRPAWHALFGGMFLVGAPVAFVAGMVLLPFSLVGIGFYGLGLLGLVPLFTGLVFLRRATYALRRSYVWRIEGATSCLLLGILGTVALPAGVYALGRREMNAAIARIERGNPAAVQEAVERLRRYRWLVYMDDLVVAWDETDDPEARRRLAETFETLTGVSLLQRRNERRPPPD